ncbi:MAG: sulfatase, partial [Candidatus Brocadiia bacterium]
RQAFCTNPTCSASRSSLLTGLWPHNNGMTGLAHRGWRLNDYGQHIIHTLHREGYHSTLCGVQHVANYRDGNAPDIIGYKEHLGEGPEEWDERAAAWLNDSPPEPFFLSVGFVETHRDFPEPACDSPETDPRYARPPGPIPVTPETCRDMAAFNTLARTLDAKMGAVLNALDEAGLAENTLVVCTTDHGIAFPRMKCNLHDSGIGIMLMLRGPGIPAGQRVHGMASHIDLFPTLCEYLEIEPPGWLQGVSLMPLLRGEAQEVREELFAEVNYHAAYEPMRCVRTPRWKYIRRFEERSGPVLPNCDDSPTKELWLENGWADREPPVEALYDLIFDPHEAHNLAGDAEHEGVLAEMRARLDTWMRETDDPLLEGSVPAPEGARVNDPDDMSANDPVEPA